MFLGRVIGTVVPAVVHPGLEGVPLLWVQPLDRHGRRDGRPLVCADGTRMAGPVLPIRLSFSTFTVRSTPIFFNSSNRKGCTSETITRAPAAISSSACRAPTGPPPRTSALSPAIGPTFPTLFTTQESTSVQMASPNGRSGLILWQARSGTRQKGARPPSRNIPMVVKFSQ